MFCQLPYYTKLPRDEINSIQQKIISLKYRNKRQRVSEIPDVQSFRSSCAYSQTTSAETFTTPPSANFDNMSTTNQGSTRRTNEGYNAYSRLNLPNLPPSSNFDNAAYASEGSPTFY